MILGNSFKIESHCFTSPKSSEGDVDDSEAGLISKFGYIWWSWKPKIHTQKSDQYNPKVYRLIWLCFAFGINIWDSKSFNFWPNE